MVVPIGELACFDLLLWLRTGASAAKRLNTSQSRVSRCVKAVADVFGVTLSKTDGEWVFEGDQTLLNLERRVHQEYRWRRNLPLRIEAQYYSGPLFCNPAPDGWIAGNFDYLQIHTPLSHLRNSVIDAWIACYPDVPDQDDPYFARFDITRLPAYLVVPVDHPLLELGDGVTLDDVRRYPSLALSDGAFPKVQKVLQSIGLWNLPIDIKRYETDKWEGRVRRLTVGYATSFSIKLFEEIQSVLPCSIPLEVGDSLVVRREFATHPRLLKLLEKLRSRALELVQQYPDVSIPAS